MKKGYNLNTDKDLDVKLGDSVVVIDGSSLTKYLGHSKYCYDNDDEVLIILAYPELTGKEEKLRNIVGTVIEINITDRICLGNMTGYLQDIVVQLGKGKFRCNSRMVRKYKDLF